MTNPNKLAPWVTFVSSVFSMLFTGVMMYTVIEARLHVGDVVYFKDMEGTNVPIPYTYTVVEVSDDFNYARLEPDKLGHNLNHDWVATRRLARLQAAPKKGESDDGRGSVEKLP